MHKDRRMAILVAVNIDGEQTVRIKRTGDDPWALDPRIPAGAQIDNKLYEGNDLDRGHLVRRPDPAWGSNAKLGEQDTFFFTNCTPQHSAFNQHLWLSLEDYLLDNAASRGFKANVFTGPVFDAKGRPYRAVLLPGAYWKVATMVRDKDGA
jgi:endonuclease G, mitochondrial